MIDDARTTHSADFEAAGFDDEDFEDDDFDDDFDDEDLVEFDDEDEEGEEDEDEEALLMRDDLPSTGLLSFYDGLRGRILAAVDRKSGKLGAGMVKVLLLAPDLFMLLARLALDRDVPSSSRSLVGGALVYFVLPVDLLPEALLGIGGYTDDVVLAAAVLSHVFSGELAPYVRRHWSGPQELRTVLQDIAGAGKSLLGESLYTRLKALLARRGVEVEDEEGFADPGLDDETARAGA